MIGVFKKWFANAPIFHKQLLPLGLVLFVFFLNVGVLYGSVAIMSDVRAYVNGEGLWAKAQKDAVFSLRKFILNANLNDYEDYLGFMSVPLGDRTARIELQKDVTDYKIVYDGFVAGRNDPRDIPGMVFLFKDFGWVSYLAHAISIWEEGDRYIELLISLGEEIRAKALSGRLNGVEQLAYLTRLDTINHRLTLLEDRFSFTLGEASRFAVSFVFATSLSVFLLVSVLIIAVTYGINRHISLRIRSIGEFAKGVAAGNSRSRLQIDSTDEIGVLAGSLNLMTGNLVRTTEQLDTKNAELESRVKQAEEDNTYLEKVKTATLNLLEDLDVAKAKLAEEKVRDEAILSSIGDGMLATDRNGVITFVNRRAENMFGQDAGDFMGRDLAEGIVLQHEDGSVVPREGRPFYRAISTKMRVEALPLAAPKEIIYAVRKDGRRFPAEIIVSPFVLNGEVVGAVGIYRDMTREVEVEKVKTEFVSIASHQLRTPLSTINWYSEILLSGDAGKISDAQREYLMEIYRGNQRMIDLVNALLNVSRLEVGAFIVEPKLINLPDVVKDVINELKPQITKKNLDISEKYAENLPLVETDYSLSRIIFQNLLSNAVKYTPAGGKVSAEIELKDGNILIKISDTGMGIPSEQQERIFTKLFRADNAREVDPDGTGLGLYIIKSIIDQTSGKIWFESKGGVGTSFYISVPPKWMQAKSGTRKLI